MSNEKKKELEEAKATSRALDKNVGDSATASGKVEEKPFQKAKSDKDNSRPADQKTVKSPEEDALEVDEPKTDFEGEVVTDKDRDSSYAVDTGISPTEDDIDGDNKSSKKMKTESSVEAAKEKLQEAISFKIDVKKDLGSLFESEDLDEEFVNKAITIFESAVNDVAKEHITSIQEAAVEYFDAAIEEHCGEVDQIVDKYASFAVNEWAEENKIALEAGIVVEQAKSLFAGLKELMTEHNLEIDEDQVSVYEAAVEKSSDLEESLESEIEKTVDLTDQLREAKKELEVERFVAGMVETQAEKIRGLAEELDFDDAESFREKLGVLKENYFPQSRDKKASGVDMVVEDAEGDVVVEDESVQQPVSEYSHIAQAAQWMSRLNRN